MDMRTYFPTRMNFVQQGRRRKRRHHHIQHTCQEVVSKLS